MGDPGTGEVRLSTAPKAAVHRRSVANFCVVFPDANMPLGVVFGETAFEKKIAFFELSISKYNLRIEILPKTDDEVTNVINKHCELFANILKQLQSEIENATKIKIDQIPAEPQVLQQIEGAVDRTIADLSAAIQNPKGRERAIRQARIVETTLVIKLYQILESGQKESMGGVFREVQDECQRAYIDYHDKYDTFVIKFRAKVLKSEEILNPLPQLWKVLRNVPNLNDVVLLVQATCRMFQLNCWGAVVTADYTEIFHNRDLIYGGTLLTVCDPLYLLQHLDSKIQSNPRPQDQAKAIGLSYTELVSFPARPPHIA